MPANWQVRPVEMQRLEISLREQARSHRLGAWRETSQPRITLVGARLPANWQVCPVEMQWLEISPRGQARFYGNWVWPESPGIPGDLCGSELAHEGAGSVAIIVVAVHRCPLRDSLFRHVPFRLRPTAAKRAESRHGRARVVGA